MLDWGPLPGIPIFPKLQQGPLGRFIEKCWGLGALLHSGLNINMCQAFSLVGEQTTVQIRLTVNIPKPQLRDVSTEIDRKSSGFGGGGGGGGFGSAWLGRT